MKYRHSHRRAAFAARCAHYGGLGIAAGDLRYRRAAEARFRYGLNSLSDMRE